MGWSIVLTSDREISPEEVEAILIENGEYKGFMGFKPRQNWGWSVAVDVSNPEGKRLRLGGSYGISGNIAESFADAMAAGLVKRGHKIKRWR